MQEEKECISREPSASGVHKCFVELDEEVINYGPAVSLCWEDELGRLWASGGITVNEYGNRVNFCPFCGFEAKNKFTPLASIEEDTYSFTPQPEPEEVP